MRRYEEGEGGKKNVGGGGEGEGEGDGCVKIKKSVEFRADVGFSRLYL